MYRIVAVKLMLSQFRSDNFGNTPLFEAVKNGHDRVASLLYSNGAKLNLKDPSSHLCSAVARGDSDFIKRLLAYGIDLNSKDYDSRTPLHVAAAAGFYAIAKMLSEAGASVLSIDRYWLVCRFISRFMNDSSTNL